MMTKRPITDIKRIILHCSASAWGDAATFRR